MTSNVLRCSIGRVPSLRANQLTEELLEVYEEAFYMLDPNDTGAISKLLLLPRSDREMARTVWSNHRPAGHMWPANRIFKAHGLLSVLI